MATKKWMLTDTAAGMYVESLVVQPQDVGGRASGYRMEKQRLRGGLSDGVDMLLIHNGRLACVLLPTRGMNIWKMWLDEKEIGWKSPVRGPVHPALVPLQEPSGLGWLDGFDELLARCGLESNGAPQFDRQGRLRYGLHGRISNRPAHQVSLEVDGEHGEITVTGVVDESRFLFHQLRLTTTVRTVVGEPGIWIEDQVENLSATPATAQLLYHINLGAPLLGAGARLAAPLAAVVPRNARAVEGLDQWQRYEAPQAGFAEQVYFCELLADQQGATHALLESADGQSGFSVIFNKQELPCFTLWKNTAALADGYVTGLEPATNFPNPRSFEEQQGRVVTLKPGERRTFHLQLLPHGDAASVQQATQAIAALQAGAAPQIHPQPHPEWCAP